ncbi:MAG: hypothetical protein JWM34_2453 [Ilumatobacteraceae bacterium]|nr:hypothetical protein [Ilumatobacteraceae bacterium]
MLHSVRRFGPLVLIGSILTVMSAPFFPNVAAASAAPPAPVRHVDVARSVHPSESEDGDGHYCDGCTPPLTYSGGPVMDTTGADGVTITPIYWMPSDWATPYPDDYPTIINQYVTDVAADSGSSTNVYSIDTEYSQSGSFATTNIAYKITAGTPIIDTQPFPTSGCDLASDQYTACLTDAQIRDELTRVTGEQGVPTDLAHFYPVFFPPGMETADLDGSNSDSAFCGYHRAFGQDTSMIVYGNEPFEATGCDAGQGPNGDVVADGAVGTLSHEVNEALTDPTDTTAWNDSTGHEIGDICANDYGTPLGSTDPSNAQTTEYNQVINGHYYYTQTEFSNAAFAAFGIGNGCVQNEAAVTGDAGGAPAASSGSLFTYAFPNAIDADGSSTSQISTSVSDAQNNVIEGDMVNFSVYAVSGTGECGTLDKDAVPSGADGYANVTYTASKDDVICAVVATDTQGGNSSTGTVYQGATEAAAPNATDTIPQALIPGADPTTFDVTFANPGTDSIQNAQVDFSLFPGDKAKSNVTADQVTLTYSTDGPDGTFSPVTLAGSTIDDGSIEGTVGAMAGASIGAGKSLDVTFKVALASGAPMDDNGPLLSMEVYLDQVNPGSGAGTNIADTGATDISVNADGTPATDAATADTSTGDSSVDTSTGDTTADTTADTSADASANSSTDTASADTATTDAASDVTIASDKSSSDSSSSTGLIIGIIAAVVVIGVIVILVVRKKKTTS